MGKLETSLGRSWPQIQELLEVGGAVEARGMLLDGLMKRATARFVKLVLGPTPKKTSPRQLTDQTTAQGVSVNRVQAEVLPPLVPRRQI